MQDFSQPTTGTKDRCRKVKFLTTASFGIKSYYKLKRNRHAHTLSPHRCLREIKDLRADADVDAPLDATSRMTNRAFDLSKLIAEQFN